MCKNEVKEIFVIRVAYMKSWTNNIEKTIRIYDRYKVEKETPKTYMTTTGKYFRKIHLNNPVITYGGEIEVISPTPYFNEEVYDKIKTILLDQQQRIHEDLKFCEVSLKNLDNFKGVQENA